MLTWTIQDKHFNYFRGAHGIFIVYDLTDRKSFERLRYWIDTVNQYSNKKTFKILVGNKRDLYLQRVVSYDEASLFANTAKMIYIECSAKEYSCIQEMILIMINNIYQGQSKDIANHATTKIVCLNKIKKKNCV